MAREIAYLSHNITDTTMCPNCHHMTIQHIETTVMTENGVNGNVQIRTLCEECYPEGEENE